MSKLKKVDVCIVGSGAGGAVVAKELGSHGVSVVVLEAGKRFNPLDDFTVATSNDWEREFPDHKNSFRAPKMDTITLGNNKSNKPNLVYGVGGGTLRYLANYIRLLPDDFRVYSSDGVAEDWPITYEELAPYYKKVEMELGVSGKNGDPWFPLEKGYINPPFEYSYACKALQKGFNRSGLQLWPTPVARLSRPLEGRPACIHCGTCDFGCMIRAKSCANVTYVPNAELTAACRHNSGLCRCHSVAEAFVEFEIITVSRWPV
jgi:choline dehydrogenase-like flavoprotein